MRSFAPFLVLLLGMPNLCAQKRVEAGVFLDYLSISQTGTSNYGIGGRFGYRVHHDVMAEGELAYGYGVNFNEAFRNVINGNLVAIERTSVGVTHGLFGIKLQPNGGVRPFVTVKAGFIDFRLSPSLLGNLIPSGSIVSDLLGLRTSSVNAVIYPAGGLQAAVGPIGLRFELGDEVYFSHGARSNLRVTFGPIVRF